MAVGTIKNYIKKNIEFKNCNDIKNFIKYITIYEFSLELEDLFYKEENKEENNWFIKIEIYNNQYNTKYYSFKKIDKKEIENYLTQSYLLRKLLREIVPQKYQAQLCKYKCTFTNIKNEKICYKTTKNLNEELDNELSFELYEILK